MSNTENLKQTHKMLLKTNRFPFKHHAMKLFKCHRILLQHQNSSNSLLEQNKIKIYPGGRKMLVTTDILPFSISPTLRLLKYPLSIGVLLLRSSYNWNFKYFQTFRCLKNFTTRTAKC